MLEFFKDLFFSKQYIPHGHCYLWQTELVWLHVLSDLLIMLAYYSIPLQLLYFVRRRADVPFKGIFVLFSLFIVTCGTTHLMAVWTLWHPAYWLSGAIKAVTALVSCYTVLELAPILPQALALPSPAKLKAVNRALEQEIAQRQQVEEKIRQLNEHLEQRVSDRTAELKKANQELERSNLELQDFASVASHDLQEPLRKIQTFGDRLQAKCSEALTGKGQDYLERMLNAAGRAQILINDLLAFSRVTTKAKPFVPVNLTEVVQGVLSDLEVRIEEVGAKVELTELPVVEADPLQMRQLFQNLICNALKFSREGVTPTVEIQAQLLEEQREQGSRGAEGAEGAEGAREQGSKGAGEQGADQLCQITVADNGIGFEEKYLDRIFNVFQRLHSRNEYQGTGVGLAICRKIVERHGGRITAKSTPEEGATFIVTLPVKQLNPSCTLL